jgi:glutaredoxin
MRFTVYSKTGCGYCEKVKTIFDMAELDYVVHTIDDGGYTYAQFAEVFGYDATFPQVVLNDETVLGGCRDTIKYLRENAVI